MNTSSFSRRRFLAATAAGVGALSLPAWSTPFTSVVPGTVSGGGTIHPGYPHVSPGARGPYRVRAVVLENAASRVPALRQFFTLNGSPGFPSRLQAGQQCQDGTILGPWLPPMIRAAIHFPYGPELDLREEPPGTLRIADGPLPVVLYAHGFRDFISEEIACHPDFPIYEDFKTPSLMLSHLASWGFVVVTPDLSWLPGARAVDDPDYVPYVLDTRAQVLAAYFFHVRSLNTALFRGQLDPASVMVVGHSTGGAAALRVENKLQANILSPDVLCHGLLAPAPIARRSAASRVLVLEGTDDTLQGVDPPAVYNDVSEPKTLVTLPGANHFGYTNLVTPGNVPIAVYDNPGRISRAAQQLAGAAYLTALLRFSAHGDVGMVPYLSGARPIPELADAGVITPTVISSGFQGAA